MIELLIISAGILFIIINLRFKFKMNPYMKICFILFMISVFSYSISRLIFDGQNNLFGILGGIYMPLAFVFVVMHSYMQRGVKLTVIMFLITLSVGLISEILGVKYGWVYGSYYYTAGGFFFGLVPLMTPVSWAIIIYMAYSMTNLLASKKINVTNKEGLVKHLMQLIMLIIFSSMDGLIAMNLDLILDPVAVSPQIAGWVWINGGPYYGVPISNFVGWFACTFFATIIFRTYVCFQKDLYTCKVQNDYYLAAMYMAYFIVQATTALSIGHSDIVLIGIGSMMPFCIIITCKYLCDLNKKST